ncbi:MFS transporter [Actinospongicola halichondriae]|uniref:MFS transporter n=1 Tax=Actinospongicola halichondriae TaxID=3236844 RepID=UPI003D477C33
MDDPSVDDGETPRSRFDPRHIVGRHPFLPLLVLFGLNAVDELDRSAFAVLAPNIRDAFGLSIAGVTSLIVVIIPVALLIELPIAWLADRKRRTRLAAGGGFIWAGFAALTGLAPTLAVLVIARMGSASGKTLNSTHNSLISDYYPQEHRARAFYFHRLADPIGKFVAPLAAGLLAAFLGWRAPFLLLAIPSVVVAFFALRLVEPARGRFERLAAGADEATADIDEEPATFREAWRTVMRQRTARRIYLSMPFLSASVVGIAIILSLFYEEVYGVKEAGRGIIFAIAEPFGVAGLVLGAIYLQGAITRKPARAFQMIGLAGVLSAGCLAGVALSPNVVVAVAFQIVLAMVVGALTPGIYAVISLVLPPNMRTQGFAMTNVFILLGLPVVPIIGGIGDNLGLRTALLFLLPVLVLGGLILGSAGRFVEGDIARVNETARANAERRAGGDGDAPLLRLSGVDLAYGQTQVLFGVDLEVRSGEMLALLGTNGAGKSTVLKAISGLAPTSGGSVFFDGRDITGLDANDTFAMGIAQVPGGRGVFPSLSVAENLRIAGWSRRGDKAGLEAATKRVLGWFPVLEERWDTPAGNLSGGEQQMLSIGQAFLSEPTLLMIDELSLGLAPAIVERLLEIVREVHANGTTVILVEQSVHVALRLAERAVFMEKGEIRFEGPTADLLERDDILRSVYLKGTRTNADLDRPRATDRVVGTDVVLSCRGLSKGYGGVQAVSDVALEVYEGEVLGIVGPNGAGKTTLFDLLTGFTIADEGEVHLGSVDVTTWPAHRRAVAGLGRTFQDARLWPSLTVRESLVLSCERSLGSRDIVSAVLATPSQRASEAVAERRADELIELVGLGSFAGKFVSELSTGSRRMVEVASLLANEPRVILLDEPSSGIAQREAEALGPVLLDVRDALGATLVVIEHDMALLSSIADRFLALDTGRYVTDGPPETVLEHPLVVASYLGDDPTTRSDA